MTSRRASSAADLAPSALRPGAGCTESAAGGQWVAVDENGVRFNAGVKAAAEGSPATEGSEP